KRYAGLVVMERATSSIPRVGGDPSGSGIVVQAVGQVLPEAGLVPFLGLPNPGKLLLNEIDAVHPRLPRAPQSLVMTLPDPPVLRRLIWLPSYLAIQVVDR